MILDPWIVSANRALPPLLRLHRVAVPNPESREIFTWHPVVADWVRTRWAARQSREPFDDVAAYCFFLGSPRSGHSLFGSLLDAHPNIVVAHELDALPLVDAGYSRRQLFWAILDNSRRFAACGRGWSEYSYAVPGQWQGRYSRLRVVGDKKGGASTLYLSHVNPRAIDTLRRRVGVPLRVFFYYRNPFDTLATMARRVGRTEVPLHAAQGELARYATMQRARSELDPSERFDVHHEQFLRNARATLKAGIEFLGEEASDAFLDDATRIVHASPSRSRTKARFGDDVVRLLEQEAKRDPMLAGYSFDSD